MSTPEATPKTVRPTTKTEYVILASFDDEPDKDGWQQVATARATSAEAAIRTALDDATPGKTHNGRFVAIPARSFQPVRVSVETVSRVKLEDA